MRALWLFSLLLLGCSDGADVAGQPDVLLLDDQALLLADTAAYGRAINGQAFQDAALLSFENHQFAAWFHADAGEAPLYLARRGFGDTAWQLMDTGVALERSVDDAHNVVSLGVSADGRLHLSWDQHVHDLNYLRSTAGAATAERWDATVFEPVRAALNPEGVTIRRMTYPRFYRDRFSGTLWFSWREGGSGDGRVQLARYDESAAMWQEPMTLLSGEGLYTDALGESETRNAYLNGIDIDRSGSLHFTWTWRESAGGSNHDILYARLDSSGKAFNGAGDALSLPITIDSPGIAIAGSDIEALDRRNSLMNQQAQVLTPDGTLHVLMWHAREAYRDQVEGFDTRVSGYFHYRRDPLNGHWYRTALPEFIAVGSRPALGSTAAGDLYALWVTPGETDPDDGLYRHGPLQLARARAKPGWQDWTVIGEQPADFVGEPRIDRVQLEVQHILSVFLQKHASGISERTGTPLWVLEWTLSD